MEHEGKICCELFFSSLTIYATVVDNNNNFLFPLLVFTNAYIKVVLLYNKNLIFVKKIYVF